LLIKNCPLNFSGGKRNWRQIRGKMRPEQGGMICVITYTSKQTRTE
jgi:hypothetical protein